MTFRPIQNDDDIDTNIDNIETKLDTINASIEDLDEVASGSADSGNPVKVGGVYNATPPTLDDGDRGDLQMDVNGNEKVTLATALDKNNDSITSYPAGHSYKFIEALGTSDAIKTGAGVLHSINVYPGHSDAYIVVRDSLDGNNGDVMAVLGGANIGCYVFDEAFTTGLSISSVGTTTCKFSISYR